MRIIDNKKDYYDFMVGKYGLDENIIFDRRGSYMLAKAGYSLLPKFFSTVPRPDDKPKEKEDAKGKSKFWRYWNRDSRYDFLVIEVGTVHYQFQIERYLDDRKKVHIDIIDHCRIPERKKKSKLPLAVISDSQMYDRKENNGKVWYEFTTWRYKPSKELLDLTVMPIFEGTFIAALIPPEQIWLDLSEYLGSLKDIKITDNRTDIQKLESAGFDKKTSFRKM